MRKQDISHPFQVQSFPLQGSSSQVCQSNFQVLLRVNWLQVNGPSLPQTQQKLLILSYCCTHTQKPHLKRLGWNFTSCGRQMSLFSDRVVDSVTVVAGSLQLFSACYRKFSIVKLLLQWIASQPLSMFSMQNKSYTNIDSSRCTQCVMACRRVLAPGAHVCVPRCWGILPHTGSLQ